MTATIDIDQKVSTWKGYFERIKQSASDDQTEWWALRNAAIAEFERLGFPSTKHEEWKYTSLMSLVSGDYFRAFHEVQADINRGDVEMFYNWALPPGLDGDVIVLVDDHFDASLSRIQSSELQIGSLKAALESGDTVLAEHYGKVAGMEGRALVALNTALVEDGAFIRIPKKTEAARPIIVLHLSVEHLLATNTRTFIHVEAQASAQVVELWHDRDHGKNWENHVSEILIGDGASLELMSLQNEVGPEFSLTHFAQVRQGKDSTFRSTVMSAEGHIVRNDLQVLHLATGCNTYLNGLTVANGTTHIDHHTLVDHAQPRCYSNENYKTVLNGNSTSVFNGKVMVRPDAQKTNAFQSNKTLLLSNGARVNTKPQLEIFADDVKCSHGATTGQLDETALFYMRSRGLSAAKAKSLLTYAFGAEVLEQISIPVLRDHLEAYLFDRLGNQ